ncbi:hypothetical protein DRN46_03150 [Thermococci archaeon]|nr:MAG: hypothetical protein DRN46_03150 [Thermococci archaeon]RLF97129.1 MAG: hypothetical protein DRN52_01070 [Thermococci archaeon]
MKRLFAVLGLVLMLLPAIGISQQTDFLRVSDVERPPGSAEPEKLIITEVTLEPNKGVIIPTVATVIFTTDLEKTQWEVTVEPENAAKSITGAEAGSKELRISINTFLIRRITVRLQGTTPEVTAMQKITGIKVVTKATYPGIGTKDELELDAPIMVGRGECVRAQGEIESAKGVIEEAKDAISKADSVLAEAMAKGVSTTIYSGRVDEAKRAVERAEEQVRSAEELVNKGECTTAMSTASAARDTADEAKSKAEEVTNMLRQEIMAKQKARRNMMIAAIVVIVVVIAVVVYFKTRGMVEPW